MRDKIRVLVIEAEPGVLMMIVRLLTQVGCDVEAAWDGQIGMEKARAEDFDLITLEVDLPGTGGFEVCRQLKENSRSFDTPVIFVSWHSSLEYQQQGLEFGAVDYITKPFEPTDFISRIVSHAEAKTLEGVTT